MSQIQYMKYMLGSVAGSKNSYERTFLLMTVPVIMTLSTIVVSQKLKVSFHAQWKEFTKVILKILNNVEKVLKKMTAFSSKFWIFFSKPIFYKLFMVEFLIPGKINVHKWLRKSLMISAYYFLCFSLLFVGSRILVTRSILTEGITQPFFCLNLPSYRYVSLHLTLFCMQVSIAFKWIFSQFHIRKLKEIAYISSSSFIEITI